MDKKIILVAGIGTSNLAAFANQAIHSDVQGMIARAEALTSEIEDLELDQAALKLTQYLDKKVPDDLVEKYKKQLKQIRRKKPVKDKRTQQRRKANKVAKNKRKQNR